MVFAKHGEVVELQCPDSLSKHWSSHSKFRSDTSSALSWRCRHLQGCRLVPHFNVPGDPGRLQGLPLFNKLGIRRSLCSWKIQYKAYGNAQTCTNALKAHPTSQTLLGCYTKKYQSMPASGKSLKIKPCHLFLRDWWPHHVLIQKGYTRWILESFNNIGIDN